MSGMGSLGIGRDVLRRLAIAGGALLLAALLASVIYAQSQKAQSAEDATYQAEGHCEDWVRQKLKAPTTADFTTTSSTGAGQGPWTFAGTVDAENSFGAKIRNKWECRIELNDGLFTGASRMVD